MRKISGKIILFGSILLSLLTAGCTRTTVEETVRIRTLPASIGSIQKVITFVGNVTPSQSSELSWSTIGVISHVYVRSGDTVTEGQVLATLADDSLSAAVINAEIPLINAQEELENVFASETPKKQAYKELKDKEAALIDAESFRESRKGYTHFKHME